jgi:ADP-heptose:LPS heptosyltransferase
MQEVQHIAVFRALKLGDLLCATPALRALHAGRGDGGPTTHVTLIGLPWAEALAQRLDSVDDFVTFPGHPQLPERSCSPERLMRFIGKMRRRRFDLALQMHGSGTIVNPLVGAFGARRSAGFRPGMAEEDLEVAGLDQTLPWPQHGTEIERCLALTDALGCPRRGLQLDFPLHGPDRAAARALLNEAGCVQPYVIVHAGSQWPSRRWLPERFAAVADALAGSGLQVVLTGTQGEAGLVAAVRSAAAHPLIDLCGRTDLFTLGALVEAARLVVCNDTGISHVAAAVKTPSVVISCGSEVPRWAPLDRHLHRVRWMAAPCRPCGHLRCPTQHECATGVEPTPVIDTALELLALTDLNLETPCPSLPLPACASSPGMSTATTCTT